VGGWVIRGGGGDGREGEREEMIEERWRNNERESERAR